GLPFCQSLPEAGDLLLELRQLRLELLRTILELRRAGLRGAHPALRHAKHAVAVGEEPLDLRPAVAEQAPRDLAGLGAHWGCASLVRGEAASGLSSAARPGSTTLSARSR